MNVEDMLPPVQSAEVVRQQPELVALHAKLEQAISPERAAPEPEPEPELKPKPRTVAWEGTRVRKAGLVTDMYRQRWTRSGFRRECAALLIQFRWRRFKHKYISAHIIPITA